MVDLVKIRRKAKEKKEEVAEKLAAAETLEAPPQRASAKGKKPVETLEAPSQERTAPPSSRPAPAEGRVDASAPPRGVDEASTPPAQSKLDRFKQTAGRREEVRREETAIAVAEGEQSLELLTFTLAGEQYAIEIEKIVEIVSPRTATRVPNAASGIVGIISLRGTIVTILDVRRMLGHPPSEGEGADTRMIVVEHAGEIAGFVVDKVWRKISIDPSEVESHPVVSASEQSEYIRGVFQQGAALSIVLDLERLLRR